MGLAVCSAFGIETSASAQAPAGVGLARVGPIDPASGFPLFYEDASGLRLGLCMDPNLCFTVLPNPALPPSFPANFPDEAFYFAINGSMAGPSGASVTLVSALEAAFAGGGVAAGDQIVFTRLRLRLTGLVDGGTYRITHPYGVTTKVAGVDGPLPGTINVTEDIGIGAPGDFAGALKGNVGPFVTTLGFTGAALPGAFIGDAATLVQIQGSPLGTNFLRIEGPNADVLFPANASGTDRAQLNEFVIQGQVATRLGAAVTKAYLSRTATQTSVNVWATTATGQSVSASVDGGPSVPLVPGIDGQYFARVELGAGAARPAQVAVSNLTDFPPTTLVAPIDGDAVAIQSAIFTVNGDLMVSAASTDKVNNPALTATIPGFAPVLLGGTALLPVGLGLPLGTVPPRSVTVTSAAGGIATVEVLVEGVGSPAGTQPPVVANAGPDLTTPANSIVALSGLGSTGPIASFAWVHDAGAQVLLQGANTSTPFFTAPNVAAGARLDITLTLTVSDGLGAFSSDSVVVHVEGPVIQPPVQDVVTIQDARYNVRRNFWRASGTTRLIQGQTVSVYLGAVGDRSRLIQVVPVDALGAWTFLQANGAGPFAPQAGDTTVWAESSLGGTPGSRAFRLN